MKRKYVKICTMTALLAISIMISGCNKNANNEVNDINNGNISMSSDEKNDVNEIKETDKQILAESETEKDKQIVTEFEIETDDEIAGTEKTELATQTKNVAGEEKKSDIVRIQEIIGQKFKDEYFPRLVHADIDKDGIPEYIVTYKDTDYRTRIFRKETLEEITVKYTAEELESYIADITEISREKEDNSALVGFVLTDKNGNTMTEYSYVSNTNESLREFCFEEDYDIHYDADMGVIMGKYIIVPNNEKNSLGEETYSTLVPAYFIMEYNDEEDALVITENYYIGFREDIFNVEFDLEKLDISDEVYYDKMEFTRWEMNIAWNDERSDFRACEVDIDGMRKAALYNDDLMIIYYRNEGLWKERYIIKKGNNIGSVVCSATIFDSQRTKLKFYDVDKDNNMELVISGWEPGTNQSKVYTDFIRLDPIKLIPVNYDFDTLVEYVKADGQFGGYDWILYSGSFDTVELYNGILYAETVIGAAEPKYAYGEYLGEVKGFLDYVAETDSFEYNGEYLVQSYVGQ